jgi:hypothetical protein
MVHFDVADEKVPTEVAQRVITVAGEAEGDERESHDRVDGLQVLDRLGPDEYIVG